MRKYKYLPSSGLQLPERLKGLEDVQLAEVSIKTLLAARDRWLTDTFGSLDVIVTSPTRICLISAPKAVETSIAQQSSMERSIFLIIRAVFMTINHLSVKDPGKVMKLVPAFHDSM